jgi:hypothetical protein
LKKIICAFFSGKSAPGRFLFGFSPDCPYI